MSAEITSVVLWIHALAGATWVAACLCVMIAGLALDSGSQEQRSFITRALPKIDALNLTAAVIVLVTGAVNLTVAGIVRRFHFSSQFGLVIAVKVMLFLGMITALVWAMRTAAGLRDSRADNGAEATARAVSPMLQAHGAIAVMGGVAMLLGLWLMGS